MPTIAIMLTVAACGDGTGPTTGTLELTTHTTGRDLDPDGYTLSVDAAGATQLPANGTVSMTGLTPGAHAVTLASVAANCVPQDSLPLSVTRPADGSTRANVSVVYAFSAFPPRAEKKASRLPSGDQHGR